MLGRLAQQVATGFALVHLGHGSIYRADLAGNEHRARLRKVDQLGQQLAHGRRHVDGLLNAIPLQAEPSCIDQAIEDANGTDVQWRVGLIARLGLPFVGVFEVVLDFLDDIALQETVAGRQWRVGAETPAVQVAQKCPVAVAVLRG